MSAVWIRVRAEMRAVASVARAGAARRSVRGRCHRSGRARRTAIVVPGALLLANAIPALPGRLAWRVRPALVLRTE